jgi:flavin reductase (DIM6/NTAB) family NADH-FMN oxidoreductase RutF
MQTDNGRSESRGATIDPRAFRDTLGLFTTGVAVIVTREGDEVHAMTASAVSSLSLEPPLVLFCPARRASLARNLDRVGGFSINFLREEQHALSSYFAGAWKAAAAPPFRFVSAAGAPRLEGALASLGCEVEEIFTGGDHLIVVGRVLALHRGIPPRRPLLFFGGEYRSIGAAAGQPAPDLTSVQDEPAHVFYME